VLFVGRVPDTLRATLAAAAVEHEEHAHVTDAELADCYRRADVVYFASTHEGFGLPIVEAQAVGRPVITSRLCSMPEVAGDAALLVDPYDVQAIRAALLQLIESADLRAELVSKGFANVSRFDRAAFAEAHLDVYRGLAS
jgi:glycosyltransferase involved in cell wall biosynthesis